MISTPATNVTIIIESVRPGLKDVPSLLLFDDARHDATQRRNGQRRDEPDGQSTLDDDDDAFSCADDGRRSSSSGIIIAKTTTNTQKVDDDWSQKCLRFGDFDVDVDCLESLFLCLELEFELKLD